MPDVIHLLPDSVANQIAAGEVIQRPASVVKELAENAVDAGSSQIRIILRDGGKTLIQVIDNGCGMSETDARMSFERHATSKIKAADDLYAIRTLGFRGEALASVASVAQVNLKSKRANDETGTEINISASEVDSQHPVACATGSIFTVRNLFFNVPARRKFLKSSQAELRHIIYEFQRISLANPHIGFDLVHNDTELYHLPPGNIKQRILHLFGRSTNQNLATIEADTSLVVVKGFIGKPENARRTSGEQFFFINNRYMKHPYFNKAVLGAYESLLPPETFPSYFIYLEADPETIDINIHPTKTEIKFENETAIFQIIQAATREAIGKTSLMPSIDFDGEAALEFPPAGAKVTLHPPPVSFNPDYNPFEDELRATRPGQRSTRLNEINLRNWDRLYDHEGLPPGAEVQPDDREQGTLDLQTSMGEQNFIQLRNGYILTGVRSGLMVIDQKRAHERILYERYIRSLAMNQPVAQRNLFPETLELDAADYQILKEIAGDLQMLGFDISDFGNNTFVINGCPSDFPDQNPLGIFERFLETYKTTGDIKTRQREKLARSMAAANAVGYGEKLTGRAMQELVDSLFACENPNYSPDGKPVVFIIPFEELERKIK